MIWILILLVISIIILHIFKTPSFRVYGTHTCGWTVKQLDYLGNRAKFHDCDKGECPPDIKSFPVTIASNGQRYDGYTNKI